MKQIFRYKPRNKLASFYCVLFIYIYLILMELNVEKTKLMRISRQPSPVTIMIDQNNWRI